ncbi:hypothetical protein J0I05_00355 [Candidatus Saccharibacteria bacterium]|nr:hypothetical protein [Candidatus Saccharibacteria bacterium]
MNIIKSSELGLQRVRFGEQTGSLTIYDGLSTPFSDDTILLTKENREQIAQFTEQAAAAFGPDEGPEPTYVQNELGLPSLVVRTDCTIIDGKIVPYEMEDSPSGQGITDKIHRGIGGVGIRDAILNHYLDQVGQTPLVIVSGARGHGTDDDQVFGRSDYLFNTNNQPVETDRLVIVKAIPGDEGSRRPYMNLQSRALMPLVSEGDKTYLRRLGLMKSTRAASDLLVDDQGNRASQVVKAQIGSMAMGVSIYLSNADKKRFTSASTVSASRLERDMHSYVDQMGGALVQPFYPPVAIENPEGRKNAILRVFSLLSRENGEIKADVIGGCYVARPELIVHGASNAVSGAVIVESGDI